jgi:hypothetical protein
VSRDEQGLTALLVALLIVCNTFAILQHEYTGAMVMTIGLGGVALYFLNPRRKKPWE